LYTRVYKKQQKMDTLIEKSYQKLRNVDVRFIRINRLQKPEKIYLENTNLA